MLKYFVKLYLLKILQRLLIKSKEKLFITKVKINNVPELDTLTLAKELFIIAVVYLAIGMLIPTLRVRIYCRKVSVLFSITTCLLIQNTTCYNLRNFFNSLDEKHV